MLRGFIVLASLGAIVMALAIGLAGPGVRFGFWEYGQAFGVMRMLALPVLIAAGASLIALLLAIWKARGLALMALVSAVLAGMAGYVPLQMRALVEANPFIHDVTTDFERPPPIVAAASLPRRNPPEYAGGEIAPRSDGLTVAEAQRRSFPDIVPADLDRSPADALTLSIAVIKAMGLELLSEERDGDAAWRLEAVSTSFWYGFKDDFVVRGAATESGGCRIDVRSKSRVGGSDLGANAARVRQFTKMLKEKASATD